MDKKVTVLTPNGRRQNVKVTPNTTLLQILEEACQKHEYDSDEYGLKHHNKELDLTQMFRFSGLPNNCLLEMTPAERKRIVASVDICVQLEDGSRAQGQFKPSDSLWHVVEQLGGSAASDFESPVAIYMRKEIIGRERISQTSLKSLGITEGRAMIRFINKNPEELKTQANVYIPPVIKEKPKDEDDARKARSATNTTAPGGGGFALTKDIMQSLKKTVSSPDESAKETAETEKMDIGKSSPTEEKPKYDWGTGSGRSIRGSDADLAQQLAAEQRAERERFEAELEAEPEMIIIGERNAILYSLDATQKQIEDLPDSFFDLTVHDLKLVLRDLKNIAAGNENAPLLTEKLREMEENKTMLNKIAQYKNCVIRIKFPDRYVLQGMFKPVDKVDCVVEFVRKFLHNQEAKFHLFTIPPKTVLPLDKTLLELDFVPTAVVHFAFEDEEEGDAQTVVKAEFLNQLTSAEGAFYAANKFRISNRKSSVDDTNNNHNENSTVAGAAAVYERKSPGPSTGAIPKRPRSEDLKQST